jgi:hypothetical protein
VRHIPEWTRIGFTQDAIRFRKTMAQLRDVPYEMVKEQIVCLLSHSESRSLDWFCLKLFQAQGKAKWSFTASLIEREANPSVEQELRYKWASGGLYSGEYPSLTCLKSCA